MRNTKLKSYLEEVGFYLQTGWKFKDWEYLKDVWWSLRDLFSHLSYLVFLGGRIHIRYLWTGLEEFNDVNLKIGFALRRYYIFVFIRLRLPPKYGKLSYVYRNLALGYFKEEGRWLYGINK